MVAKKFIDDMTQDFYYLYMPINDCKLSTLLENKIYFSSVNNFDDPIDAAFIILTGEMAEKLPPEHGQNKVKFEADCRALEEKIKSEFGVCCMSKHATCMKCGYPDLSIVMLSSYADRHKGIVIEYEQDAELIQQDPLKSFRPVKYKSKFQHFNYEKVRENLEKYQQDLNGEGFGIVIDPLLFKFKEWSYQNEYRLFNDKPREKRSISDYGLRVNRIFSGFRTEKAVLNMLEEILKVKVVKIAAPVFSSAVSRYRVLLADEFDQCRCSKCSFDEKSD